MFNRMFSFSKESEKETEKADLFSGMDLREKPRPSQPSGEKEGEKEEEKVKVKEKEKEKEEEGVSAFSFIAEEEQSKDAESLERKRRRNTTRVGYGRQDSGHSHGSVLSGSSGEGSIDGRPHETAIESSLSELEASSPPEALHEPETSPKEGALPEPETLAKEEALPIEATSREEGNCPEQEAVKTAAEKERERIAREMREASGTEQARCELDRLLEKRGDAIGVLKTNLRGIDGDIQDVMRSAEQQKAALVTLRQEGDRLRLKREAAEAEQQDWAEKEDFERAAAINEVLEGIDRRGKDMLAERHGVEKRIRDLEKSLVAHLKQKKNWIIVSCEKLKAVAQEDVHALPKKWNRISDHFVKNRKRIESEKDRLQRELEHVKRDEETLRQEMDATESIIDEQTEEFTQGREALQMRKFQVDADILDLKRRLEELEKERGSIDEELGGYDEQIAMVRQKFERQLTRLRDRERFIESCHSDCVAEQGSLMEEETALGNVASEFESMKMTHKKLTDDLEDDIEITKILSLSVDDLHFLHLKDDEEGSVVYEDLESEVNSANEVLALTRTQIEHIQLKTERIDEDISDMKSILKELEDRKKAAVVEKNYKEAANFSKEIKSRVGSIEENEKMKSDYEEELRSHQASLKIHENLLDVKEASLESMKKEREEHNFMKICKTYQSLKNVRKRLKQKTNGSLKDFGLELIKFELESLKETKRSMKDRFDFIDETEEGGEDDEEEVEAGVSEGGGEEVADAKGDGGKEPPQRMPSKSARDGTLASKIRALRSHIAELEETEKTMDEEEGMEDILEAIRQDLSSQREDLRKLEVELESAIDGEEAQNDSVALEKSEREAVASLSGDGDDKGQVSTTKDTARDEELRKDEGDNHEIEANQEDGSSPDGATEEHSSKPGDLSMEDTRWNDPTKEEAEADEDKDAPQVEESKEEEKKKLAARIEEMTRSLKELADTINEAQNDGDVDLVDTLSADYHMYTVALSELQHRYEYGDREHESDDDF